MRHARLVTITTTGLLAAALAFPTGVLADQPLHCTILGTPGDDLVPSVGRDEVFCGGEGNDRVAWLFGTFVGGPGDDWVHGHVYQGGHFIGGDGNEWVLWNEGGIVEGGPGDDRVSLNIFGSTFIGGEGNDTVEANQYSVFEGNQGDDRAESVGSGIFTGGPGSDSVGTLYGKFVGGPDYDWVDVEMDGSSFVPGAQ